MSEFASNVLLVKKKLTVHTSWQLILQNLIKDAFSIPNITDSVNASSESIFFFSTLDLWVFFNKLHTMKIDTKQQ